MRDRAHSSDCFLEGTLQSLCTQPGTPAFGTQTGWSEKCRKDKNCNLITNPTVTTHMVIHKTKEAVLNQELHYLRKTSFLCVHSSGSTVWQQVTTHLPKLPCTVAAAD